MYVLLSENINFIKTSFKRTSLWKTSLFGCAVSEIKLNFSDDTCITYKVKKSMTTFKFKLKEQQ